MASGDFGISLKLKGRMATDPQKRFADATGMQAACKTLIEAASRAVGADDVTVVVAAWTGPPALGLAGIG